MNTLADITYGSDRVGMVWAYEFTRGGSGAPLDSDGVAAWLAGERASVHRFVWVHVNLSNAAAAGWLEEHFELPEAFVDSMRRGTTLGRASTRVEVAERSIVAVLNDVRFFALDKSDASTVSVCAQRAVLVTARTTPLRSVDRLREAVKAGEAFRSPAELLAHLLRDQADVLVEIVRDATDQVDHIEDRLLNEQGAANRPRLGGLRRTLVRLQRLLAPEPAALFRLLNRPPEWVVPDDMSDLRQAAEELAAAVADSAALVERVRLLQEEVAALVNEQTNRTLYVLTVVTVLALPMTIIPGLLGMNVGGVPLRDHAGGFWIAAALVVSISGSAAWWAFGSRPDQ